MIFKDYLKSASNLKEMLKNYSKQNPKIDINIITPKASYMEEFLSKYKGEVLNIKIGLVL